MKVKETECSAMVTAQYRMGMTTATIALTTTEAAMRAATVAEEAIETSDRVADMAAVKPRSRRRG